MTNADAFSIFSSHYQRIGYSVIIAGAVCIAEFSSKLPIYHSYYQLAYILNFTFLLLQMAGMLSNPLVTLAWLAEQVDVHVLGATPRASDSRIAISFVINAAIVVGMYLIYFYLGSQTSSTVFGVVLAWVFSHNILLEIGTLKPFRVVNEKAQYEELYSRIAFGLSPAAQKP